MAPLSRIFATVSAVWLGAASVATCLTVKGKPFPSMIDVTLDDLQEGLGSGLFTSVDLVNTYIARIMEVNSTLNVVTEVNPDALSIAAQLDAMRANGTILGPLHGVPILIKNNIATDDKMNNTAGSWSLLGAKVPEDSFIAKKLRQAGAIILGKTNLSQWANYRSSNSSNGWSAYGGQCFGAYYPNQDPSGSSSGSGVSSSIGLALASLGSETSGSIISPSQMNNLAGIKPTVGLTSRYLVIPISEHQDTVGPLARTVKDAATLLQAIAGVDPKDNYTLAIPNCGKIPDYVAACNPGALKGARIGIPYNVLSTQNTAVLTAFNAAVALMEAEGAIIVPANFTNPNAPTSGVVLEADFVSDIANYLSQLTFNPNNITNLAQLRAFTQSFKLEDWPDRNTATWDQALALGYNNTDGRFWAGYQENLQAGGPLGMLGAIQRNNVSALLLPSSQSPGIAAGVGAPIVTVPLGFWPVGTPVSRSSRGLVSRAPKIPFGISFLGDHFSEATLISLAYAFEQKTMVRNQVQPYLVPNIELGDYAGF